MQSPVRQHMTSQSLKSRFGQHLRAIKKHFADNSSWGTTRLYRHFGPLNSTTSERSPKWKCPKSKRHTGSKPYVPLKHTASSPINLPSLPPHYQSTSVHLLFLPVYSPCTHPDNTSRHSHCLSTHTSDAPSHMLLT